MSVIEEAIVSKLQSDADVFALVADRVRPIQLAQAEKMPAITYLKVDAPRTHSLAGASGFANARFQITCWAEKYFDAKTLANRVRSALQGFRGTVEGVDINGILLADERDLLEAEPRRLHRVDLDFQVMHNE